MLLIFVIMLAILLAITTPVTSKPIEPCRKGHTWSWVPQELPDGEQSEILW